MGPCDIRLFEMQILTYAHCPSTATAPIDRLKQTLLIIEYLMTIIKSLQYISQGPFKISSSN